MGQINILEEETQELSKAVETRTDIEEEKYRKCRKQRMKIIKPSNKYRSNDVINMRLDLF